MSEQELIAPAPEHCPGTDSEAAGKASGTIAIPSWASLRKTWFVECSETSDPLSHFCNRQ